MFVGLLPHGQLDPPLWSQRGIGRIFPWPPKNRRRPLSSVLESTHASCEGDETPIDYVFRVVNKSNHEEFRKYFQGEEQKKYIVIQSNNKLYFI